MKQKKKINFLSLVTLVGLLFLPALTVLAVNGWTDPLYPPDSNNAQFGPLTATTSLAGPKIGFDTYNFSSALSIGSTLFQGNNINPKIVATLSGLPAIQIVDMKVAGNYAYVAFSAGGASAFRIIDITNPLNPFVPGTPGVGGGASLSNLPISGFGGFRLAISGKYVYMLFNTNTRSDEFRIIDVSDPTNPVVHGGSGINIPAGVMSSWPTGISVVGNYAYLTFNNTLCGTTCNKFRIIDVSDPDAPVIVSPSSSNFANYVNFNGAPRSIYVSSNLAYIGTDTGGPELAIVDIENPKNPIVKGQIVLGLTNSTSPNYNIKVFVEGNYVYLTTGLTGANAFRVFDSADPAGSQIICPAGGAGAGLTLPASPSNNVLASGRYVYVTFDMNGTSAFRLIDTIDCSNLQVVGGQYFDPQISNSYAIAISGRYLFIGGNNGGFKVAELPNIRAVDSGVSQVPGLASVTAHTVEAGNLQVLGNTTIKNNLNVKGGLTVKGNATFNTDLYVDGSLMVKGSLNVAGVKTFRIDNPANPEHEILTHSFVESDQVENFYDGVAILDSSGRAEIVLPNYFEALNRPFDGGYSYLLTAIGQSAPELHIKKEISNNRFTIAGGAHHGKVSWQVTGVRNDRYMQVHPFVVEGKNNN